MFVADFTAPNPMRFKSMKLNQPNLTIRIPALAKRRWNCDGSDHDFTVRALAPGCGRGQWLVQFPGSTRLSPIPPWRGQGQDIG